MHKYSNEEIPKNVEYTTVNTEEIENNENHNKENEQTQSLCTRIVNTAKQVIRRAALFILILYIFLVTGLVVLLIMKKCNIISETWYSIFYTTLNLGELNFYQKKI
ncbi:hypothetical protein NEIG_02094 [Nematocida sp. ERTm5]|nr:hypothetical protein NEIG_02094 [Nematocida sp. ERTm5]